MPSIFKIFRAYLQKTTVAAVSDGIGSRKGKVVNDKGNLQWRFPVNSASGRTVRD